MIIKIYWNNDETQKLFDITNESLEELWLREFINLEKNYDPKFAEELSITLEPAFCIEEDTIELKTVIFEWFIPEKTEITSMLMSIVWWEEDWCWWSCDWCGHWGSCH